MICVAQMHLELRSQLWSAQRRAGDCMPEAPVATAGGTLPLWPYQEAMLERVREHAPTSAVPQFMAACSCRHELKVATP